MAQPSAVGPGRVLFEVGDAFLGGGVGRVEGDLDLGEGAGRSGAGGGRGDRGEVAALDEGDVEPPAGDAVGPAEDDELTLRRARHDGRALHRVGVAAEVDVVQPVAVEVSAGGDGPDDRVVLPGVPQGADDLDSVAGLPGTGGLAVDVRTAPDPGRLGTFLLAHQPAAAPDRDVVEGRQLAGDVEGFGVGDRHDGRDTDDAGRRGEERGPLDRSDAADDIGGTAGRQRAVRQCDQGEPGVLRGGGDAGHPAWGEQMVGRVGGAAPGRGVGAVTVEFDGEPQGGTGQREFLPEARRVDRPDGPAGVSGVRKDRRRRRYGSSRHAVG